MHLARLRGRLAHHRRLVGGRATPDVLHAEEDHGDVVAPAGRVGGIDERLAGGAQVGGIDERALDLLVGDHRRQPVRAEQEHVAVAGVGRHVVDLDRRLGAQRAGDDRALRVLLGLFGGQLAAAHHLAHERVVVGELLELCVAEQVGARVADVPERHGVLVDVGRRERRPHAGALLVLGRLAVDEAVGLLGQRRQPLLGRAAVGQPAAQAVDDGARGNLARLRTAHPVRHGEHRRVREERVLVGAPRAPGVRVREEVGDAEH